MGYVISRDRYLKRDELGVIFQLCVAPEAQRGLIGASLLKAVFDRSAYGCRLYCCWCAQDLEANFFWESMGFVPIAFRAGGRKTLRRGSGQGRVHIFWQRRINLDDRTTAYWYPCQTSAGAIRADRLVLPIPPGTHWSDAKPVILPETEKTLPGKAGDGPCKRLPRATASPAVSRGRSSAGIRPAITGLSGLRFDFGAVGDGKANGAGGPREPAKPRRTGNASAERSRTNDPRRVAAARELRDRWMERVNAGAVGAAVEGKYEVGRALPCGRGPASLAMGESPRRGASNANRRHTAAGLLNASVGNVLSAA